MKKSTFLYVLILVVVLITGSFSQVMAVDTGVGSPSTSGGGGIGSPTPSNNFYLQNPLDPRFRSVGDIVIGFLEILSYLAVLAAVLMLIWTGLQFVLARGKPEKLKELKTQLLWIVIGVAVIIGARIIVTVVIDTLSATGVVSPTVIQSAHNALDTP